MLNIDEINAAIRKLENGETTLANCSKLATLHTVRDHLIGTDYAPYSYSAAPVMDVSGDSDFLRTVSGRDNQAVMDIMDDLMDTLRVAMPKAYRSVMERLRSI